MSQQPKSQADSGYHGSSQVEETQRTPEIPPRSPLRTMKSPIVEMRDAEEEIQTNEGSFHSAKENQTLKINVPIEPEPSTEDPATADAVMEEAPVEASVEAPVAAPEFDDIGSPSDESTPDRPLVRKKSSMTFASLPAREPLKQSIGARVSRTSHLQAQKPETLISRQSVASDVRMQDEDEESSDDEDNVEILGIDSSEIDSQAARQYSKASTQRLHERIDALGKAPPPRPSKSIPSAATLSAMNKSSSEHFTKQQPTSTTTDDEDDWIKPLPSAPTEQRLDEIADDTEDDEFDVRAPELIAHEERLSRLSPTPVKVHHALHAKSASTATLASPYKTAMAPPPSPSKSLSISYPAMTSTTPMGSPKRMDGPLSASKSKLASIMKTAKGLFTSSASVSAAAKMEAIAPQIVEQAITNMPGMFPDIQKRLTDKPLPASPPKEYKKTRSSTEREKEEKRKEKESKAMQQMEDQLMRVREQEKHKVAQQKAMSPRKAEEERLNLASTSKMNRPVRPTREVSKARPQPVSIKVGTLSQRIPTGSTLIATGNQETLPAEPKRPGLVKKASNASSQSSASTFKTSVSSQPTKPKALLAAERKREQDEREANRKLEQKRELERKRAAQQEEAKKQEQEQRVEAERKERERVAAEKAKRQAQQEAVDRKRQEAARKAEAQRVAREAPPARPPSRLGQQMSRPLINHPLPTNPAKPAKRPVEEEQARPQAPKYGAASQSHDAKRRKTEDESIVEPPARPTMSGAPIRQSQLGKKPSIFNHPSYTQAAQPHLGQFPQPPVRNHPPMAQFATSKIPFAEPAPAGPAKTPVSGYHYRTIQAVKSSPQQPQYTNGENIHLPEIPTDSEDEDSEDESNAFPIPDWATPGHLTEQLVRQEGMDGDAVFGPVAPLKMEEIFAKGNKDRLKRLRDRTSSANWVLSGDGLTLEEVKVDREKRERMRLEGGWRYGI